MSNGDTVKLELIGSITSSIPSIVMILYSFVVSLAIIQVVGIDVLKAYTSYKEKKKR